MYNSPAIILSVVSLSTFLTTPTSSKVLFPTFRIEILSEFSLYALKIFLKIITKKYKKVTFLKFFEKYLKNYPVWDKAKTNWPSLLIFKPFKFIPYCSDYLAYNRPPNIDFEDETWQKQHRMVITIKS